MRVLASNTEADTSAQITESDEAQQTIDQRVSSDIVEAVEVDNGQKASDSAVESEQNVTTAKGQHDAQEDENEKKPQVKPSPLAAAEKAIISDEKKTATNDQGETKTIRKQLIIYGVIAAIIGAVMIVFAITLGVDEPPVATDVIVDDAADKALMLQREQEEKKYRQLQIEAETLKRERDAAIAKAEAERLANEQAEKQAAAAAALAAKAAAEKTRAEELKRVEQAKQRAREAKQAEIKAKEAAKRARLEAARLEEQKRLMQIRLDEEKRLQELQEARRVELERLEAQRLQQLAAEEQARQAAAAEAAAAKAAEEARTKLAECSGPTAKFKSGCR